ncbi:MAG TPA: hypothetical protein VFJ58_01775 [Armatimonadota bacterium]|nr:hypothetical protein [Armatimonadota bacterium]
MDGSQSRSAAAHSADPGTSVLRRSGESQPIPLNLILDYPVFWSKYKVLRDFVQNFYDAVGHQTWASQFHWEICGDALRLFAADVGFSYDWLIHIGASTKRDSEGQYAGYFGEGFKIASLCAIRDYHWRVELASRDWELEVTTSRVSLDGRSSATLSYLVWKRAIPRSDTVLSLSPISPGDRGLLEAVLMSFYFEDNSLFGEKIWSSDEAAIFRRSNRRKPNGYPVTWDDHGDGIVFAGYQALGSFGFPLVICLHTHRTQDRERNTLYRMDVIKLVRRVVELVPPGTASRLLEMLSTLWYRYPRKRYDFDSWYDIIKTLVSRVARCPEQTRLFNKKYPNLLVASQVRRRDIVSRNKRCQALAWKRQAPARFRLVQDSFQKLGYPTLEEVCEKNNGFPVLRELQGREVELAGLLMEAANELFPGFFGSACLPPCRIIQSKTSVWKGMAECVPVDRPRDNPQGAQIRYRLPYVALKAYLFAPGMWSESFSTYLHELSHVFGGDHSANFSHALTNLLDVVLRGVQVLVGYEKRWDALFIDDTAANADAAIPQSAHHSP